MQKQKKEPRPFAIMDKSHLVPGLFQVTSRNRVPTPLKESYELNNGLTIVEIKGVEPLTPFDALMLCVIVHKAKIKGIKRVTPDHYCPAKRSCLTN